MRTVIKYSNKIKRYTNTFIYRCTRMSEISGIAARTYATKT